MTRRSASTSAGSRYGLAGDAVLHGDGDAVEVGGAGQAVDPGHAVDQDGGGEDAEQEVLHAALEGGLTPLGEGGEDIGGQGRELDGDEDHHQIAGGADQHRAEDGEGEQHVELANRQMPFELIDVGRRGDDAERRRDEDHQRQEDREPVGPERPPEGRLVLAVLRPERGRRQAVSDQGDAGEQSIVMALRHERVQHHQQQRQPEDNELRVGEAPVRRRQAS